nr:Rv3235 family protein [Homoserinibacter gongjuensis]
MRRRESTAQFEHSPYLPSDDLFGRQPASAGELPDPRPLLENLTRCVIEIIAGARDLEQIARWVDDSVYTKLLKRVVVSAQARQAARRPATRPVITLGNVTVCEPRDGVVEAVIIVHSRMRTRAVAIRLEDSTDGGAPPRSTCCSAGPPDPHQWPQRPRRSCARRWARLRSLLAGSVAVDALPEGTALAAALLGLALRLACRRLLRARRGGALDLAALVAHLDPA